MLTTTSGVHGTAASALDPELSFIASQAAIELDNLLLGRPGRFVAVAQLAEYLKSSAIDSGAAQGTGPLDPQTIDVVSRAIDAAGEETLKTLEELKVHAGRLASELGEMDEASDEGKIERLRAFCVSLSQVATAQRQSILDMHPSHPFRS